MAACVAVLVVSAALAQEKKAVPPPPKPTDDGPSLEVTMKFIQDKMNDQRTVGYVLTMNSANGVIFRNYVLLSEVIGDPSTCTLHAKMKTTTQTEVAEGVTYPLSGEDLHWETVYTSTNPFKEVVSISVEPKQDGMNRVSAEGAHPEVRFAVTPPVYQLTLKGATKRVFSFHSDLKKGNRPQQSTDYTDDNVFFIFRDEDTANRLAKAMLHVVELCGGGSKDPF
jgi:hypothetical protein